MDTISINQLRLRTTIGVHSFEQKIQQELLVNLQYPVDAEFIAQEDNLQHTIDYDSLCGLLQNFANDNTCHLIETFADRMAQLCLDHFPMRWVRIEVIKRGALRQAQSVSIRLERHAQNPNA